MLRARMGSRIRSLERVRQAVRGSLAEDPGSPVDVFMTKRSPGWHAGTGASGWGCGACVRAEQAENRIAELAADMKRCPAAGLCSACSASGLHCKPAFEPAAARSTARDTEGLLTGGVTTQLTSVQEPGARSEAVGRASFRCLEHLPLLLSLLCSVYLEELGFLAHEDYEEVREQSGIGQEAEIGNFGCGPSGRLC